MTLRTFNRRPPDQPSELTSSLIDWRSGPSGALRQVRRHFGLPGRTSGGGLPVHGAEPLLPEASPVVWASILPSSLLAREIDCDCRFSVMLFVEDPREPERRDR